MNNKKHTEGVNNPEHYQGNGLEAIDVIEAFNLNFNLGNVAKYILRCRSKGFLLNDLEKASWYLHREIESVRAKDASLPTDHKTYCAANSEYSSS